MRLRWRAPVGAVLAALVACDDGRQEAQVVLEAIHRFRVADNAFLPARVDALRATPCKAALACKARDECVAVGESTAKALLLKNEVERGLAALEKGTLSKDSAEAQSFTDKLDAAEKYLKEGHEGLPRCDEAVDALKRAHHL